jgi:predicted nucleic acid-binding protein
MTSTYLDSSAIVKLVVEEPESGAVRRFVHRRRTVSSAVARTEVVRAVLHRGDEAVRLARRALSVVDLLRVNDRVLSLAATLDPHELRPLDAIHLATARDLGDDIGTFVTYDTRMADAAREMGYRVSSPS